MLTDAERCLDSVLPFLFAINCKRINNYDANNTYNLTKIICTLM